MTLENSDIGPCIDHGRRSVSGYAKSGADARKGLPRLLHRRIFLESNGFLPPVVMHRCDNPRCINPAHLVAGDRDKNNKDRAEKGRSAKTRLDLRKLTEQDATAIRKRWAERRGKRDPINGICAISRDYGVDANVVYNIVEGRTYAQ